MPRADQNTLIYTPPRNELKLNIVFAYNAPVVAKSMVTAFKWVPENETVDEKLDLTWSSGLGSYFSYVPENDRAGLRKGRTITLPGPGRLEIRLLNWPSKTSAQTSFISGLYALNQKLTTDGSFAGLQRIHGNGVGE